MRQECDPEGADRELYVQSSCSAFFHRSPILGGERSWLPSTASIAMNHICNSRGLNTRPHHQDDGRRDQAQRHQHGRRPDRHARSQYTPGDDDQCNGRKPDLDRSRSSDVYQHGVFLMAVRPVCTVAPGRSRLSAPIIRSMRASRSCCRSDRLASLDQGTLDSAAELSSIAQQGSVSGRDTWFFGFVRRGQVASDSTKPGR